MAVRRIWVIPWFALIILLAFGFPAIGQEWQPLRTVTMVRVEKWQARSCLSAARAALERGDLDGAETWALRAENAPVGFLEWVKSPWSNATNKLWREIQIARARETVALITFLDTKPTKETTAPPPASPPKKAIEIAAQPAPAKKDAKDVTWNREDLVNLKSYFKNQRAPKANKAPPPSENDTSIELLAAALGEFLQGNYRQAKRLGVMAHEAGNAKITTLPLPAPKVVETARSQPEIVLPSIVNIEPPLLHLPQPTITFVEECEPVKPTQSQRVSVVPQRWVLGMGIGLGVLVCWAFLWWCMPRARR